MNDKLRLFEIIANEYANEVCFDSKGNLIPELCWSDIFLIKFAELIRADERNDLSDLRDKFACAAMAAFINALDPLPSDDLLAKYAYETADEMLKARGEVK